MASPKASAIRAASILALATVAVWWWLDHRMSVRLLPPESASPASALRLSDTEGRVLSLADYRGRVVVLNLWASWCGPCRVEIPRLSRLHRELESEGLAVLGLNAEGMGAAALAPVARELGIDYPVLLPAQELGGSFASQGAVPQTWLIDRGGRVRASHTGLLTERSLRRAALELLSEPTAR